MLPDSVIVTGLLRNHIMLLEQKVDGESRRNVGHPTGSDTQALKKERQYPILRSAVTLPGLFQLDAHGSEEFSGEPFFCIGGNQLEEEKKTREGESNFSPVRIYWSENSLSSVDWLHLIWGGSGLCNQVILGED